MSRVKSCMYQTSNVQFSKHELPYVQYRYLHEINKQEIHKFCYFF